MLAHRVTEEEERGEREVEACITTSAPPSRLSLIHILIHVHKSPLTVRLYNWQDASKASLELVKKIHERIAFRVRMGLWMLVLTSVLTRTPHPVLSLLRSRPYAGATRSPENRMSRSLVLHVTSLS